MTFKDLCDYYIDCLKNDSVNVIFSKKEMGHYCLPLTDTGFSQSYSLSKKEYQEFLRFNYGKDCYLGFPCYVSVDYRIVPLFILKTQIDDKDLLTVNPDTFLFNNGALSDLGVFSEMPRQFIEKITSMSSIPSDFYNCREKLLPFSSAVEWVDKGILQSNLRNIIVNQPILFRADALLATYSRGLKKELSELSEIDQNRLTGTALSKIIGFDEHPSKNPKASEIFEILQLNNEQEQAIEAAMQNDISVITGPPGTGKSQIIASFVINACLNGKTVLIASKNNKAVDVVEERINTLAERPFVLRQGGGHYLQKLSDYFGYLLQAVPTDQDFEEYENLRAEYSRATKKIEEKNELIKSIIEIRNLLDKEEQEICELRNNKYLYDYTAKEYDPDELRQKINTISSIIRTIDLSKSTFRFFTYRLFRKKKKFSNYVSELKGNCNILGLGFDEEKAAYEPAYISYYKEIGARFENAVRDCNKLHDYFVHLERLSNRKIRSMFSMTALH